MKSAFFFLLSGTLSAQIASVGLKSETPHTANRPLTHSPSNALAAAPVAGYLLGPGPNEVFPLFTSAKTVKLGEALPSPAGTERLYLPPRQQYALAEQHSSDPVAVWSMRTQDLIAIPGALSHPDSVTFSPRGDSALFYSQASASLQVVTHLPAEPAIARNLKLPFSAFEKLAVSDDGEVVVASLPAGRLVFASGAPVQTSFSAQALSFIPKTHNLAIVDAAQKIVVELSNIESSGAAYRILAQDVDADQLLCTRGGEQIVAASLSRGEIWTIDLKTSQLSQNQESGSISTLLSLRDGYTFLLSQPAGLSLMKLAEATH